MCIGTLGSAIGQSLKLLTSLNYLVWKHGCSQSNSLVSFCLCLCVCVYLMWSMIYLNSLMACTVFAQTLKTRCCCGRSSEGVNLSATSGYACQNPSLSPYLCHSTFIIPSLLQSPHLSWPSLTSSYYHLSSTTTCDDDDVTLMPVSCSDCVLEIICILSVLACCTSVWSPGIILKKKKKACLKRNAPEGMDRRKF